MVSGLREEGQKWPRAAIKTPDGSRRQRIVTDSVSGDKLEIGKTFLLFAPKSDIAELRHAAQLSPELGFETATLRSLADLLYLPRKSIVLSYKPLMIKFKN